MLHLEALHHVIFEVQDRAASERFAQDFGLHVAARDERRTYLRGAGPDAYQVVLESSERNAFLGAAFRVDARSDLERAVDELGASAIRELSGPGGGRAVTLMDPSSFGCG